LDHPVVYIQVGRVFSTSNTNGRGECGRKVTTVPCPRRQLCY